jgi:hypothetical protein
LILLILLVLRRILFRGVDVAFIRLAGLPGLAALLTLTVLALILLTALWVLPLAVLTSLLLIFCHIVCHEYSSIDLQSAFYRAAAALSGLVT